MRKLFGLIIMFLTLIVMQALMGGNILQLINMTPICFIFLSVIGALCVGFPINLVFRAFCAAFFGINTENKQNIKIYSKILNFAGACSIGFGVILMFLGLIQVCQNLSDPFKIGAYLSIAILSPMYGFLLAYILFYPLATNLEAKMDLEQ